jgi:hypothetical protein
MLIWFEMAGPDPGGLRPPGGASGSRAVDQVSVNTPAGLVRAISCVKGACADRRIETCTGSCCGPHVTSSGGSASGCGWVRSREWTGPGRRHASVLATYLRSSWRWSMLRMARSIAWAREQLEPGHNCSRRLRIVRCEDRAASVDPHRLPHRSSIPSAPGDGRAVHRGGALRFRSSPAPGVTTWRRRQRPSSRVARRTLESSGRAVLRAYISSAPRP